VFLTRSGIDSSVSNIDARDPVVRPSGNLQVNVIWGADGTPDWTRIRSDTWPTTDNANYGLGCQMDAQNNNGMP